MNGKQFGSHFQLANGNVFPLHAIQISSNGILCCNRQSIDLLSIQKVRKKKSTNEKKRQGPFSAAGYKATI